MGLLFSKLMFTLGRKRVIYDRDTDEPYLERYYIFLKERTWFPFNIFLHKFLKSDPDDMHSHPWSFATLILWGGYYEHTLQGVKWHGPGSFRVADADRYHRVELYNEQPCWTLFVPLKKKQNWGFLTPSGWVSHVNYRKDKVE